MLLDVIDKVFKYSLGEENTKIVFDYLDKKSCSKTEIPQRLPLFSLELRKVMDSEESRIGRSRASVQGSALIIEQTIVRMLCLRLAKANIKLNQIHLGELTNVAFGDLVMKLKEACFAEKRARQNFQVLQATSEVRVNGGEVSNGE